jgi:hypothetical protein
MLGFGALLKYTPSQRERQKAFISSTSQVAPMVTKYTPTVPANNEEESAPAQLARMQNSEGKVPPSDIQAESLQIMIPGIQGNYLIDASSTLIAKIYFKKKQFVWEFVDVRSTDPSEKNKKKRIEVKFGDIISMILVAKEGQMGSLTIGNSLFQKLIELLHW